MLFFDDQRPAAVTQHRLDQIRRLFYRRPAPPRADPTRTACPWTSGRDCARRGSARTTPLARLQQRQNLPTRRICPLAQGGPGPCSRRAQPRPPSPSKPGSAKGSPAVSATSGTDNDLAAKLAARRRWESADGDHNGAGGPAGKANGASKRSPPAAPAGGKSDDLAAKLAARRQWEVTETGTADAAAPAPPAQQKPSAMSGATQSPPTAEVPASTPEPTAKPFRPSPAAQVSDLEVRPSPLARE